MMRITVQFILSCMIVALSRAHVLYPHHNHLPYAYYGPYAPGYPYGNAQTYIHPYTYRLATLKDHLPGHEGVSDVVGESQPSASSSPSSQDIKPIVEVPEEDETKKEDSEKLSTLSEKMPQNIGDLKYYTFNYPIAYSIPIPLTWPISTQYHNQDSFGQYHYGYASPLSAKEELKTLDGMNRNLSLGSYSYVDSNRKLQAVDYVSDESGFRVLATNLPKRPEPVEIPDSEEIRLAKLEHFKAQEEALNRLKEANMKDGNVVEENESKV